MIPQVGDIWAYVPDIERRKYLFLEIWEERYDEILFNVICLDTGQHTDAWYSKADTSLWEFVA